MRTVVVRTLSGHGTSGNPTTTKLNITACSQAYFHPSPSFVQPFSRRFLSLPSLFLFSLSLSSTGSSISLSFPPPPFSPRFHSCHREEFKIVEIDIHPPNSVPRLTSHLLCTSSHTVSATVPVPLPVPPSPIGYVLRSDSERFKLTRPIQQCPEAPSPKSGSPSVEPWFDTFRFKLESALPLLFQIIQGLGPVASD
ncbi:hypothetical protein P168DRAFT_110610 [Aspergillus campestris IBT 28561]|uniref:Uncharacterized protein n=1 Tax=Aspergillus campestris (strain IBT 28561) TaxID=1392248 RepID=A0A2I1D919_ASPC2|nr:uncharacterized protein P168DRAFT_110610 [Aspergillus campestris IBT 28561]PKY06373.1 hypothetical protein P168DRAFT_110610 [Aspergillus campestris IBT 28561]